MTPAHSLGIFRYCCCLCLCANVGGAASSRPRELVLGVVPSTIPVSGGDPDNGSGGGGGGPGPRTIDERYAEQLPGTGSHAASSSSSSSSSSLAAAKSAKSIGAPLDASDDFYSSGELRVATVSCGWRHTAAVTSCGRVLTWGDGNCGQLGHGTDASDLTPRVVDALWPAHPASAVACGDYHTVVLTRSGNVFTFGDNAYGELGHGGSGAALTVAPATMSTTIASSSSSSSASTTNGGSPMSTAPEHSPKLVRALRSKGVVAVDAGHSHSMAMTSAGEVYAWGRNQYGQLGTGDFVGQALPVLIEALPRCKSIACGGGFSAAVGVDGSLWTWGCDRNGQLGHGVERHS
jgi:alpha-tubulin suppressor-like RCC1 family protein